MKMASKEEGRRILWVDDEINQLQAHIIFLQEKGFVVTPVPSGDDAISAVRNDDFDLVLLDEMMPGRDGLSTLEELKEIRPSLPVVMVTKNEEENLMEQAIGRKISDYLTKPVNPSQILLVIKRLFDAKRIRGDQLTLDYVQAFNRLNQRMFGPMDWVDWIDAYKQIATWEIEISQYRDIGLAQTHAGQKREWNAEFAKYIEKNYPRWLTSKDRPALSADIIDRYVLPHIREGRRVFFIVIDCMRLDQWMNLQPIIEEYFSIDQDYYFSILPTATPFARNAIFLGDFPDRLLELYPDLWRRPDEESSLNKNEPELLNVQLKKKKVRLDTEPVYAKVLEASEGENLARKISTYQHAKLMAMVFNFIDILAHGRSESDILQELAPNEDAFRSVTKSWFEHSSLLEILKYLATIDCRVVITADHGAVIARRATLVKGKREASTNLRYKYGDNLNCNTKEVVFVKNPENYRLPRFGIATTYIFAREDYYFIYPTQYHRYESKYADTFQHGGISMDEMILPIATLIPKR
jgi:CheY-like chemotaxis protein